MSIRSSMSRLLFGFSHQGPPLSQAQRARYIRRVGELDRTDWRARWLAMVPGVAAVVTIPVWTRMQKHFSFPWQALFQMVFAACVMVYVFWLLRRRHRRFGPRVLRELGFDDICGRCAYDLSRSPQAEGRCPECGEPFSQFRPDRTWTTDQP
jgi:hypothetical protein